MISKKIFIPKYHLCQPLTVLRRGLLSIKANMCILENILIYNWRELLVDFYSFHFRFASYTVAALLPPVFSLFRTTCLWFMLGQSSNTLPTPCHFSHRSEEYKNGGEGAFHCCTVAHGRCVHGASGTVGININVQYVLSYCTTFNSCGMSTAKYGGNNIDTL
jgi:hypothetical protein